MLYHPQGTCDCRCHAYEEDPCLDCMVDDGVEPVGKIDWYSPVEYGIMWQFDRPAADRYRERWQAAYTARGWQFPG